MSYKKHRIGIYPGTFDPMTNGNLDVLLRAKNVVDKLVVGISTACAQNAIFTPIERSKIVGYYLDKHKAWENVEIATFDGLLTNFATSIGSSLIIRGLRACDFEYEFQMSCMNSRLAPDIDTVFIPAHESHHFTSARLIKEICSLGGDVSEFVLPKVAEMMQDKLEVENVCNMR